MIIVKAPLRISLGGGGTDLPEWYKQYGGFLISATINKYIYFTGSTRPFDKKIWLSYSKVENCDTPEEVKHELFAKCLSKYKLKDGIEIHSISEVPGNSGLGSSGSFLVGALTLLNSLEKVEMSREQLAESACHIEMVELERSSGKQDQYISALGGICSMSLSVTGEVSHERIDLPAPTQKRLENNLFIYYTGIARNSEEILGEQSKAIGNKAHDKIAAMKEIQDIGYSSRDCLLAGDLDRLGELMHTHWMVKKTMSSKMSSDHLDQVYEFARDSGASGGKIMGAGGGGYWMFYVPENHHRRFREKMATQNLIEMIWGFDNSGCTVIYSN